MKEFEQIDYGEGIVGYELPCECECGSIMRIYNDCEEKNNFEFVISNTKKIEESKHYHNFLINKENLKKILKELN